MDMYEEVMVCVVYE